MIHFLTTRPHPDRCPRCGRLRLTGLAEGWPYRVDPAPLTALAELVARIHGRQSWWLHVGRIVWRSPERIAGDAMRGRPAVLATHECGAAIAADDIDAFHVPAVLRAVTVDRETDGLTETELDALELLARQLGARALDRATEPPY